MQVKYWMYPWPNLYQIRNPNIRTGLVEVLAILVLLMVVGTWGIHMVLMVAVQRLTRYTKATIEILRLTTPGLFL
jgi:hypothetical protein